MSSAPASQPATPNPEKESELIYGLESHPPFGSSLLAALQHILAMVLSVMAPPAIVAGALGVPPEAIAYLVSMSLLFAGIGIWFQVSRPFGIGSGMLSIQATSFAFPGTLIAVGALLMKEQGMSWEQALSTLFGVCFIGGFVVMAGSRIMPFLRKIITPTVAGAWERSTSQVVSRPRLMEHLGTSPTCSLARWSFSLSFASIAARTRCCA